MKVHQVMLLTGLTQRSSEMEIIHAGVAQVTQAKSIPCKENRLVFCFSFCPVPEEQLSSAIAIPETKFPKGPYIS